MPTKPPPQIDAWSYSRLTDWEQCALKAKFKHVDKIKEPQSDAMARGELIHKKAEQYSTGQLKTLPPELANFREEFIALRGRKKDLHTEQQIALDKLWAPVEWYSKAAWVRVICDCYYLVEETTAIVIDYKTGKVRVENTDQLELYALAMFAVSNTVERVEASLWYLDAGEIITRTYTRDQEKDLRKRWVKRSLPMLRDRTFKPKPSRLCEWCHHSKSKGGACQY